MSILLDTQTLLWFLLDDPRLSKKALEIIVEADESIFVQSWPAFGKSPSSRHRAYRTLPLKKPGYAASAAQGAWAVRPNVHLWK